MDNKSIETISNGDAPEALKLLLEFNSLHEKSKAFKEMDITAKEHLWDAIFSRMKSNPGPDLTKTCLNSLRILSREKPTLEQVMTDDRVQALLTVSGLDFNASSQESRLAAPKSVEGLKVIFNMVFQSPTLQIMFISNGILSQLIKRIEDFTTISTSSELGYPQEYQYFVSRILFLITALCQDTAPAKVRNLFNGLPILNTFLESRMKLINMNLKYEGNEDFDIMTADIICEVQKVLYNLIADLSPKNRRNVSSHIDDDDLEQLKRITRLTRILLNQTFSAITPNASVGTSTIQIKKQEIRGHSVDLLAAIPSSCFGEFIPPIPTGGGSTSASILMEFEGHDMSAVESTVEFLDTKLDDLKRPPFPSDAVAPPLYALHNMSISSRLIRKYLKRRMLPPLNRNDVINLPEVGSTIRNKLVSLLTSPVSHITDLVANLLFVLCKENVGKLVKYTGYGNAAGLLANKGLMLGGRPPPGKYSESESDSDTEEYREVEHMINQVEGRIQLERPDPMEGMTDEQKEFEAMKLISAINKMDRCGGGIKPCKIGPDGRPVPIEHVLQLQEALENPMKGLGRDESDSDSD